MGLLVLSRKVGEYVDIGGGIEVVVVDVRIGESGIKVRLGFRAPPEVPIHRREVTERIAKEGGGEC